MSGAATDELSAKSGSSSSGDSSDSSAPELATEPARLDRYLLLEQIGHGSSASVWAAYDPQLDRRVAIKVLRQRAETSSKQTQLAEAQALARLSHPNVVAVHDVQSFSHGVFIVMEFLAGISLREWMDQPHHWREVVAVFCEAGRGLAAAHERGLVHRDFKPSNVMFGADGRVRVLDFGLARSTSDRKPASSQSARPRIAGTPAYMAPEQHLGEPVDARSDQFAFCVALYEALYGQRPFAGRDRLLLGKAKLRADIRPPPRGASVPAWLHAVVLRGLTSDRNARWPDMSALLDALARDPKLVRRRWTIAIASTFGLAGAALGFAYLGNDDAQVCAAPERELVGVWDDGVRAQIRDSFAATQLGFAEQAYQRVERALDAHTHEWLRLHREVCEATLVRHEQSTELMNEQMLCLHRRLRRIGGLVNTLAQADATSVARAGDVVLTLESPATCRERVIETHALDPAQRAGVLALEGEIARAGVLTQLGRYEQAIEVAQQASERALELGDAGGAGRAWLAQTRALWYLGRFEAAVEASEQAMRFAAKVGDRETVAMAQIRLIRTYTSMGKFEIAEAVAKLVAPVIEDGRLGHELEAWYDLYVAILNYKQMRFEQAIVRLEHGLAVRERLYGPGHAELAAFHNTWGNVLFTQGELDGALAHYREAARLWERNFGPEYPDLGSVNNNIGAIHLARREYQLARPYFERVLASYELSITPDNPQVAMTMTNLGAVDERQGRLRSALALHERARTNVVGKIGEDNVNAALIDRGRAQVFYELGELERAEAVITRVIAIQRRDAPDDIWMLIACMELLADAQYERGDLAAWRTTIEGLLELVEQRDDSKPRALYLRAQLVRHAGDQQAALELAEQYIAALSGSLGANHEDTTVRLWLVIELLIDLGRFDEAATRARAALDSTQMDPGDRRRWQLEYLLGVAEAGRGHADEALAAWQRALEYCSGPNGNLHRAQRVRDRLDALRR